MTSIDLEKISHSKDTDKGLLLIAASAISFSSLPIFFSLMPFQNLGLAVQVSARLVVGIASVLVWQIIHKRKSISFLPPQASQRWFFAMNGFALLGGFVTYNLSVGLGTAPAKAVLLAYTSPLQTAILSAIFLKEKMGLNKILAILGGVAGTLIALGFWRVDGLLTFQLSDAFAVLNGSFTALILIFARKSSSHNDQHPFISLKYTLSSALIWVLLLTVPASLIFPDLRSIWTLAFKPQTFILLLGLGVLGTTLPYFFLYSGSKYLPASITGLIMLLDPVFVFILQALFLNEPIFWWQILGGVILFLNGYLIREDRIKQVATLEKTYSNVNPG